MIHVPLLTILRRAPAPMAARTSIKTGIDQCGAVGRGASELSSTLEVAHGSPTTIPGSCNKVGAGLPGRGARNRTSSRAASSAGKGHRVRDDERKPGSWSSRRPTGIGLILLQHGQSTAYSVLYRCGTRPIVIAAVIDGQTLLGLQKLIAHIWSTERRSGAGRARGRRVGHHR